MFAVVEIAGTQVTVAPNAKIFVPRLESEIGTTIKFNKVLLKNDDTKTAVGSPFISESFIEAKVLNHTKDSTVIVFKKKKRKGYRVRNGHRQQYTEIEITKIA